MDSSRFTYVPSSRKEAVDIGSKIFSTGDMCKGLHFDYRFAKSGKCRSCERMRIQVYRALNPKKVRQFHDQIVKNRANRYREDPEYRFKVLEYNREYHNKRYHSDPEYRGRVLSKSKEYKKAFTERGGSAEYQRKYKRGLRASGDEEYISRAAWRSLLSRSVRAGWVKSHSTEETLGYTPADLRRHITKLFKPGMSWSNKGEWHIDHIRPISSFPIDTHPSVVHALDNLQPLWAEENMEKGDKW